MSIDLKQLDTKSPFLKALSSGFQMNSLRRRTKLQRVNCPEGLETRQLLTFSPAVSYAVETSPADIAKADFNNDGKLDLAVVNGVSHSVSILAGHGDGTFQPAVHSPTGNSPVSLAVGDFNSDGKVDVVTANNSTISVLLGNGNGSFHAPASSSLADGSSPTSIAVGDFNSDGKLDLAVTGTIYQPGSGGYNGGYYGPSWYGSAHVLLGNGSGTFTPNALQSGYGYFTSAELGDFNSDGKLDFAMINVDPLYGDSMVEVFPGTGSGNLGLPVNLVRTPGAESLTSGNINNDQFPDLVAAGPWGDMVYVLLGTVSGSFQSLKQPTGGIQPIDIALSDFNSDGWADLMTAGMNDGVGVLLGTGNGIFRPPLMSQTPGSPAAVMFGDFNRDGRTDAASANTVSNNVSVLINDNQWTPTNAPSLSISDATVTEGNLGSTIAEFTVSLSKPYSQSVTVDYSTIASSATGGIDYESTTGNLTFAAGELNKTIAVIVKGDRIGEPTESFSVKLTNAVMAFLADPSATGTILDDEPVMNLTTWAEIQEGNAGTRPMEFLLTLSSPYDIPVTVDFATGDNLSWELPSATAGSDYLQTAGTLSIPAGHTSAVISVPVIGDRIGELAEYFEMTLSNAVGAAMQNSKAAGIILDDEPIITLSGKQVVEGNSGSTVMNFQVFLSEASDTAVTVSYSTTDGTAGAGSDYGAAFGTLTIPAGQLAATIPVQVTPDLLPETDEYFSLEIDNAVGGRIDYGIGYGTIIDDDTPPTISISDNGIREGNSGTQLLSFTVSLSQISSRTIQVSYTTVNDTARTNDNDYVANTGILTFLPGETTKTISVVVRGDRKKERNESFFVRLSRPTNSTLAVAQAIGIIYDDDSNNGWKNGFSSTAAVDGFFEDVLSGGGRLRKRRR